VNSPVSGTVLGGSDLQLELETPFPQTPEEGAEFIVSELAVENVVGEADGVEYLTGLAPGLELLEQLADATGLFPGAWLSSFARFRWVLRGSEGSDHLQQSPFTDPRHLSAGNRQRLYLFVQDLKLPLIHLEEEAPTAGPHVVEQSLTGRR